jgi:hypothetical protein
MIYSVAGFVKPAHCIYIHFFYGQQSADKLSLFLVDGAIYCEAH